MGPEFSREHANKGRIRTAAREASRTAGPDQRPPLVLAVLLGVCWLAAASGGSPMAALAAAGCAVTWLLVPPVTRLALALGATASPGGRSIHRHPTPYLGGVAVMLPVLAALAALAGTGSATLLAGCALLLLAGLWDDARGLAPGTKILAQVAAAGLVCADGLRIEAVSLPPVTWTIPAGLEVAAAIAWVVLVTNAVNLIDGLDGLCSASVLVACVALVALGPAGPAPVVLAGGLLGFLRHNLPPARIFLGDAGSLTLGFLLAVMTLRGGGTVNAPLAVGLVALPLGDVVASTVRRGLRGKPLFSADRGHIHHRLLRMLGRPRPVLAVLVGLAAVQAALAVVWPDVRGLLLGFALWCAAGAWVLSGFPVPLRDILRQRAQFKRLHVLRSYGHQSLRLARGHDDAETVLRRVCEDLDLIDLRLGGLHIRRRSRGPGGLTSGELQIAGSHASWIRREDLADQALAEERETVLCELLQRAAAVLAQPDRTARTAPEGSGAPPEKRNPEVIAHHVLTGGSPW